MSEPEETSDFMTAKLMTETTSSKKRTLMIKTIRALPLALVTASALFLMHPAIAISIVGPNGETAQPPAPETLPREQTITERFNQTRLPQVEQRLDRLYGPTGENETLWSIATRFQPNDATVYQTLGAIFRLNPGAFEDNNIHGLLPGSTLLLPTVEQVRRENSAKVASRLESDKLRAPFNQPQQTATPAAKPTELVSKPAPQPKPETQQLQ